MDDSNEEIVKSNDGQLDNLNIPEITENPETDIIPVPTQDIIPVNDNSVAPQQSLAEPNLSISQPVQDIIPVAPPVASEASITVLPTEKIKVDGEIDPDQIKQAVKKKRGLKFFVILIILMTVLLGAGGASAYTFWYSTPKKVFFDAISRTMNYDAMQVSSTTTIDTGSDTNFGISKITLNSITTDKPSESVDLGVEINMNNKLYNVGAKGMYLDSGDIYFRLDNITAAVQEAFGDQAMPAAITDKVSELEGEWVKYTIADMNSASKEVATAYQCMIDTYKRVNKDKAMQSSLAANYEKYPFFVINENFVQNRDNNYGYKVTIDAGLMADYIDSLKNIDSVKELRKCSGEVLPTDTTSASLSTDSINTLNSYLNKFNTTVWINQWTHDLSKVDMTYSDNQSSYSVAMNMTADVKIDGNLKVTAPEQSTSFSDWQKSFENLVSQFYDSYK
ncbi:hypothetical protein HGB24_02370 [Candidatus Saccharibacteria bacterium]|nr:hypothetical protein [Candidatus Saccharibacteria bacterium]